MSSFCLAVTGGTGFVGRHTLDAALESGHRVRALTRRPQPQRPGVQWVNGALDNRDALAELVSGADAVIHVAGVVNGGPAEFEAGNVTGTALLRDVAPGRPFVLVSSLAAREPALSQYGASKARGEDAARTRAGPLTIVRPPAVYGPGDTELLMLFRAVARGFVPLVKGARASMIYGPDLAQALVTLAVDLVGPHKRSDGLVFEIDDGHGGYTQREIATGIAVALGKMPRMVEVGPGALRLGAHVDTFLSRLRSARPRLSLDRAGYLAHPDWTADSSPLASLGLWMPEMPLDAGLSATAAWYREQGWI